MTSKPIASRILIMLIGFTLVYIFLFSSCNVNFENSEMSQSATPTQQIFGNTLTPLPEELLANYEQTRGVVIGGVILVLIIIIGTFSIIRRKP